MRQDEIDAANEAVQLIAAQKYFLDKGEAPDFSEEQNTITLYYDDVKDTYQCYFDYEQRLLELQELLMREIKITGKSYGKQSNGVMSKEALLDAINFIKSNEHNLAKKNGR
jgi:hypothetical protein